MKFFLYLHYLITLTYLLVPVLPINIVIKYKLFLYPVLISFYWLIFQDCHLSKLHKTKNLYLEDLLYDLFKIKIRRKRLAFLVNFINCLIPTIIIIRILMYKKDFCKY